jgi:GntR family transcriptional regulator, transcriptional repressor for pyruvate dehydrogenase complex
VVRFVRRLYSPIDPLSAQKSQMADFQPKPVHRLRQQVEEQVLDAIVSGRLEAGDRLPSETDLAAMFSVSRSTVREALMALASAGLIEKSPGATGGSFVRSLDPQRFGVRLADLLRLLLRVGTAEREEVDLVRAMLEVPACRLAAQNRSDADVATLWRIIETQKSKRVDDAEVPELDVGFHSAIAVASGNGVLAALVTALHAASEPVRKVSLSPSAGRDTVQQHSQLAQAIADQDPDAAERAIRSHLSYIEGLGPAGA